MPHQLLAWLGCSGGAGGYRAGCCCAPWGPRVQPVPQVHLPPLPTQVSNINQPLEITAISSPETSLKSSPVPYQDHDQPPVLKKERPLGQTNGAHYSPLTSDEEPGSEDEPSSAR